MSGNYLVVKHTFNSFNHLYILHFRGGNPNSQNSVQLTVIISQNMADPLIRNLSYEGRPCFNFFLALWALVWPFPEFHHYKNFAFADLV